MHTNNKINLLIRASRLYCRPKYLEFNSGYYPQIEYIIRGFINKIFGTKPLERMVKISILPQFLTVFTRNNYYTKYVGITINVVSPDTSELNFELWAEPPIINAWTHSYKPKPVPTKA